MDPDFGSRQKKSHQRVLESLWPQLLPLLVFGFFFLKNIRTAVLRVLTVETGREEKDMESRFVVGFFLWVSFCVWVFFSFVFFIVVVNFFLIKTPSLAV